MPELPEAETIVRDLRARTAGARIATVRVLRTDVLAPGTTPQRLGRTLRGRRLTGVTRRGKNVVLELEGGFRVVVNLGMTGRIVTSDAPGASHLRHIALRLGLADGRALLYDDARRFGRIDLHDATAWAERDAQLGVEPLDARFDADRLFALTRRSTTPLRNWLLDQRRIAGVGNIYANEALFRAAVRPSRRARRLSRREASALRDALRDVLAEAIAARGTTLSDYRDASGLPGDYEPRLRVYGRDGLPCTACGTAIRRVVLSGRSAFYCPRCQR
jgi:formamidopyrimidine-DNA glycosylase